MYSVAKINEKSQKVIYFQNLPRSADGQDMSVFLLQYRYFPNKLLFYVTSCLYIILMVSENKGELPEYCATTMIVSIFITVPFSAIFYSVDKLI